MRGINTDDEAQLAEEQKFVDSRTLVLLSDQDYATRAEIAEQVSPVRLRNFRVETIRDCGHWIQLEKKYDFLDTIVAFAEEVDDRREYAATE